MRYMTMINYSVRYCLIFEPIGGSTESKQCTLFRITAGAVAPEFQRAKPGGVQFTPAVTIRGGVHGGERLWQSHH